MDYEKRERNRLYMKNYYSNKNEELKTAALRRYYSVERGFEKSVVDQYMAIHEMKQKLKKGIDVNIK